MKDYCFNYKILVGFEWIQVCCTFQCYDDADAVRVAKKITAGSRTKEEYLADRMVAV